MSKLTRVPDLSFETGSAGRKDTTYRGPDEALTMTKPVLEEVEFISFNLTPLVVQLLKDFGYDLSYGLDSFDIILRLLELPLQILQGKPY